MVGRFVCRRSGEGLYEQVFSHANGFVDPGQGVCCNQPILLFAEALRVTSKIKANGLGQRGLFRKREYSNVNQRQRTFLFFLDLPEPRKVAALPQCLGDFSEPVYTQRYRHRHSMTINIIVIYLTEF
jgi:hypothetical protein